MGDINIGHLINKGNIVIVIINNNEKQQSEVAPKDKPKPIKSPSNKSKLHKLWEYFKTCVEIVVLWLHTYPYIIPPLMIYFGWN